ncbi:LLM class flavin-dependent oxidoreductase [Saccharopolyspora sp. ASAGF58]|uniref:LLM class flavin-dependent oxidoreductase n=1 Tax=Saccharopolyspora sp. ASAGF58 TaxID=2719023 RepID=UPI001440241A|nr:LLM class flavin-dependent oxidoreductase [Saccharopolyspora sp. ASAGF58]QIZ35004.1 LLM class flavin-dependent oxidoreductase [Saccharopolyspora sp. ASAGF58]
MPVEVGIFLPSAAEAEIREAAYHAVDAELDAIWSGDHLANGVPALDGMLALATAAAVTECIDIGFAVYLPALRPLVCAAKQIATLQNLTGGDRLHLGIGVGDHDSGYAAVGLDAATRGRRTDEFLQLLPSLLAGEPTVLPHGATAQLAPAAAVPPLWIGGSAPAALRRAACFGDGWIAEMHRPDGIRTKAARLRELAEERGRPAPRLGLAIQGSLVKRPDAGLLDRCAGNLAELFGIPVDVARDYVVAGTPEQVAEQLAAYAEVGIEKIAFAVDGDWHSSCDLLGQVRELLDPAERPRCLRSK